MGDLAISCEGVWKSYRIYHQRAHTLKEKVLSRAHRYEDFWALRGIDLEVEAGTTIGIIGPNGSGKSTLLKTLAKILTPNRGSLTVRGTISPLLELGTGFHPELTGRENVFLAGSLLGQPRREIERRYDGIVDFSGIESFMDIPVKNYSSGMYARLAFAVAISVDPEILIVDEVLSVGDEGFQMKCWERIAELRAEGRTIVLVSHSLPTVRTLCSKAVWLEKGTVREVGKAADVVADYLAEVHQETADEGGGAGAGSSGAHGRRYGAGPAEITEIAVLDGDGAHTGTFRTGDPFTVRVTYTIPPGLVDTICGIAVMRGENLAYVFGQNSGQAGVDLAVGEGTVEFRVPYLPLLRGHYVITAVLHDGPATKIYDCHERRHWFSVFDNPSLPIEGGMVHVATEWTSRSAAAATAAAAPLEQSAG